MSAGKVVGVSASGRPITGEIAALHDLRTSTEITVETDFFLHGSTHDCD